MARRRQAWFDAQPDLDPERLVFIDETGAGTKMGRLRGRAPRGMRCRAAVPHGHWKTTTFVGAYAYAMNGQQLPLVNGFPLRLIVPGWWSTYWVKILSSIEVLDGPDENFWTKIAYTVPDTPGAEMAPDQTGVKMCRSAA